MPENSTSPSKRKKSPWYTVMVRWDNMAKLKKISILNGVPMTQTLSRLICSDYNELFPERRKESNANPHDVHPA